MDWTGLIVTVLELLVVAAGGAVGSFARLYDASANPFSSAPDPNAQPDEWRCPDRAEFARVLGNVRSRSYRGSNRDGARLRALTLRDPLWDRELDG